jgi:hypothetical protein
LGKVNFGKFLVIFGSWKHQYTLITLSQIGCSHLQFLYFLVVFMFSLCAQ